MSLPRVLGAALIVGVFAVAACAADDTTTEPHTTTTTTTTTFTTTTSTTTGTGGEAPLSCTEDYTNVPGSCDLFLQDCPEGTVCELLNSTGQAQCIVGNGGLKGLGAPCDRPSECRNGLICVGRCSPVCCPNTDEPCGGGRCDMHVNLNSAETLWAMACSYNLSCTLFAKDCPSGEECHVSNRSQGLAVCDMPSPTPMAEGEPCGYRNDCGDSQVCNSTAPDNEVGGRCRYHCRVSLYESLSPGVGGCPAGQTCVSMNASALPDIGICKP